MNEKDFEKLCEPVEWGAAEETGELEKGEFCPDVGELSFIETNCQPGPDDYYDPKVRENIRFGNNRKTPDVSGWENVRRQADADQKQKHI